MVEEGHAPFARSSIGVGRVPTLGVSVVRTTGTRRAFDADTRAGRSPFPVALVVVVVDGPERMREDEPADSAALPDTFLNGRTEVDARVNAGVLHFVQRLREAMVRASDSDQEIIVHGEMSVFPEETREHNSSRAADR